MRLICPNCGAQYEVGDDVIPQAGRDVQCSNCGHTWFETPGASEAREAGDIPDPPQEPEPSAPPEPEAEPEPEAMDPEAMEPADRPEDEAARGPDDRPDQEAEQAQDTEDWPDHEAEQAQDTEDWPDQETEQARDTQENTEEHTEAEPPPAAAPLPRSTVSPEIARILQEEAEHEQAARQAAAQGGLESQPDLGLEAPLDREDQLAEEARRRMARMRGEAAPAIGAAVTAAAGTRRELLPDIEEINSSLRSASDRQTPAEIEEQEMEVAANRRGSRFGFSLILLIVAILVVLYVMAPRIISAVPQTEPVLTRYVAAVDDGRIWLDRQMQGLLARIESGTQEGEAPQAPAPQTEDETAPEAVPQEPAPGGDG